MGQAGYLTFGLSFASLFTLPTYSRVVTTQHVPVLLNETLDNLRLKPGERILETEIADRLKVSRTPVRDAIRRLESEGI